MWSHFYSQHWLHWYILIRTCSLISLIDAADERQDALAAYAMSLAWYITKSSQYAEKASQYIFITLRSGLNNKLIPCKSRT